ncbi:MAG TPA: hypothetical protein HPP58_07315, partial [Deltaproteobacteria bacterium]|nr:hypothetical protein [Deltaproteobacteria bacterium]
MRITIAKKLWLSFGILILVLGISGLVSYLQIQKLNGALRQVLVVSEPMDNALLEIEISIDEIARAIYGYIRTNEAWHLKTVQDSETSLKYFIDKFVQLTNDKLEKSFGMELKDFYEKFRKLCLTIVALGQEKQRSRVLFVKYIKQTGDLIDLELQRDLEKEGPDTFRKRENALAMKIALHTIFEAIVGQVSESEPEAVKNIRIASGRFERSETLFEKTIISNSELS